MKRVSRAFRNAYETALTGNAFRRGLTGDRVTRTTYLPSFRSELRRPILHRAHPDDWSRSLCGAPVIGVLVWDEPLECVVCAELLERKEGN